MNGYRMKDKLTPCPMARQNGRNPAQHLFNLSHALTPNSSRALYILKIFLSSIISLAKSY